MQTSGELGRRPQNIDHFDRRLELKKLFEEPPFHFSNHMSIYKKNIYILKYLNMHIYIYISKYIQFMCMCICQYVNSGV